MPAFGADVTPSWHIVWWIGDQKCGLRQIEACPERTKIFRLAAANIMIAHLPEVPIFRDRLAVCCEIVIGLIGKNLEGEGLGDFWLGKTCKGKVKLLLNEDLKLLLQDQRIPFCIRRQTV